MKSFVVPVLGVGFLALSCLSLHAARFIWHPGEDAEDSPFLDAGRMAAPSPHFQGAEFPTAPQQGQPWMPPKTQLPEVARVPASDTEFILPGFWSQLPHGIDCTMTTPRGDTTSWRGCYAYDPVPQGRPVLATLAVRNRSGLDQTLPANLIQDTANVKMLPDGVKLTLLYSEKMPPKRKTDGMFPQPFPQPNEFGPWTPIPIRAGSYPAPGSAGDAKAVMVLASTAEKTLFQIDLRDFFDLSRPGSYRLQTDIQRPGTLVGQPGETSFTIVVAH